MTETTAIVRYLRVAPKKVRLIARLLKGLSYQEAQARLRNLPQKSSGPLLKLLESAAANAEHNLHLAKSGLYVSRIAVDGGPVLARIRPRARGSAFPIKKRTSHIRITLAEVSGGAERVAAQAEQVTTRVRRAGATAPRRAGSKTAPRRADTRGSRERMFVRKVI
jgi:large subunit ribosomal protein L22